MASSLFCLHRLLKSPKNVSSTFNLLNHNNTNYHKCLISKWKSTTVATPQTTLSNSNETPPPTPRRDALDLTFEDTQSAYKSKTTAELFRALVVLRLCSFRFLIENNEKLLKLGKKILGPKLFRYFMKQSFYGQFVAGEDILQIQPNIKRLHSFGVKSILDYSAEEDISEQQATETVMESYKDSVKKDSTKEGELKRYKPYAQFADRRKHHVSARTYFYRGEAQCERNMETFLKCIETVAHVTNATGFAAIKMTALGRPQLLLQLSEVVFRTRKYFKEVTGTDKDMALAALTPSTIEHKLVDKKISIEGDVKKWLETMDYDKKGLMNIFSWSGLVDMNYVISDLFKVPSIQTGRMEPIITALTQEEEEMFRNMMRRLHHIARFAKDRNVRVLIDAEQTYFQPAINRITMELMRKYNKEKNIIFNTYQCYLKESYSNLLLDLELARRQNFYFGAKLVRGAYMEQERLRAEMVGYEDPINPSYEATTDMYHKCLTEIMKQIIEFNLDGRTAIMVASHNEATVRFTVNKMKELGIKPEHRLVCFGQLLGMCDQVSFLLGQAGYSVYKYVPYGKVDEVLPYLTRRAQENHGLLTKVDRECVLLAKEYRRRIFSGQWFYKPNGDYFPS